MECAKAALSGHSGNVLVICGDTPLIKSGTLKSLIAKHLRTSAGLTILTADIKDAASYGRIARENPGRIVKITEKIDSSAREDGADGERGRDDDRRQFTGSEHELLLHDKFRRTEDGRLPMPLPPNNIYFYHTLG